METTVEDSSFESEKYDAEAKTKVKVTEDDLDDDEARIKRHLARIRETKAMLTTSCNIRVVDIIRKNEVSSQKLCIAQYDIISFIEINTMTL